MNKNSHASTMLSKKRKKKCIYYRIKNRMKVINYLNIARLEVDEQVISNDNPSCDSNTKSRKPQNRTYHTHRNPFRYHRFNKAHATASSLFQKWTQLIIYFRKFWRQKIISSNDINKITNENILFLLSLS